MSFRTAPGHDERLALFVLGLMGTVSLVYQIAWTRQLTTLLGSTVTAVALITAMFMVGMALGAWGAGRRADRIPDYRRLLGFLAIGLGASGATTVPLYAVVARAYAAGALDASTGALLALAVVLAALMTLVPTAFVGAAFPLVGRAVATRRRNISRGIGTTYVAGTVGSVAGALLGGLLLVPQLGLNATLVLVSAASAGAGGLLLATIRGNATENAGTSADAALSALRARSGTEVAATPSHVTRRPALIAFALSGASIMIYEAVWTRELLLIFGASVYAVAVMLAAALTGLAIGQYLGARNTQPREEALATIGLLQLAGAGTAMLSLLLTRSVPLAYAVARNLLPGGVGSFMATQFALTFLVVAIPCILLGSTAPIAMRLAATERSVLGRNVGDAYALNTLGSVVGSLAAGLLLMPLIATVGTTGVAAGLNIAAAVLALRVALPVVAETQSQRRLIPAIALAALGLAALLTAQSASPALSLTTQRAGGTASTGHFIALSKMMSVLYSKDAPQGRVTVFESPEGTRSLNVSGMNEGALLFTDVQTTETLIRLPSAMTDKVSDILVVGLGTGMTSHTALELQPEARVDTVEINPAVVQASHLFQETPIENLPRSKVIIDDARHYYATTDARYDLIASEPSYPLSTYSARMFTVESFEAASRILTSDGALVQWLPAYMMEQGDLELMVKTFGTVFPNCSVWVTLTPGETAQKLDYVLVGFKGDTAVDADAVLQAVKSGGAEDFRIDYLMGPAEVASLGDNPDVPSNTDDRPVFEYRMPVRYLSWIWD